MGLGTLGDPTRGKGPGVPISKVKQRLLIWTPGFWPPRGPPSVTSPILLPNNDSYRQNSALNVFFLFIGSVFNLVYLSSKDEKK